MTEWKDEKTYALKKKILYIFLFLERGEEREKEREKHWCERE